MRVMILMVISLIVTLMPFSSSLGEESIKISGRFYANYMYDLSENSEDFNAFNFKVIPKITVNFYTC